MFGVFANKPTPRGIRRPLRVSAKFLLHGRDSKSTWSVCSFSPPSLLDEASGVARKRRLAPFVPELQRGVTFPSQALSAKSQYLPACRFTHLARLSASGSQPSGRGRGGGKKATASSQKCCPFTEQQAYSLLFLHIFFFWKSG